MSNHRESGPDSRRRLLLIELNEVNLDLARAYVENGTLALPGFQALFDRGVIRSSSEDAYENLEPWIQWVSVHSGKTFAEHGVFRLGDIVNTDVVQIFERLEHAGFRVGAVSPMNAANRLKAPAYFIPDPWTQTPSDPSFWSRNLSKALAQAVNDNASARLTPATLLTLLGALGRFSSLHNWKRYVELAFGSPRRPWRKALFLDLLLADIHRTLWHRHRPDFSVLFLNAGAHIQHHYLYNSRAAGAKDLRNPDWYCAPDADPFAEMLLLYDAILQDILASDDLDVLVATGLTQTPYDRVKFYYRLRDHAAFLRRIGVAFDDITTLMTRDFVVDFKDEATALAAEGKLASLRVKGGEIPLFGEIESRGNGLFVTLTYPFEITDETRVDVGDDCIDLKDEVVFVAIKNGMHDGAGFIVPPPTSRFVPPIDGAHVRELNGAIGRYFGLASKPA